MQIYHGHFRVGHMAAQRAGASLGWRASKAWQTRLRLVGVPDSSATSESVQCVLVKVTSYLKLTIGSQGPFGATELIEATNMSAHEETDNNASNEDGKSDIGNITVAQAVLVDDDEGQAGPGPSGEIMYSREDIEKLVREAEIRGAEEAENKMKRKILEHAECSICFKVPRADVNLRQCPNGHLTCEICMGSCGDACSTCREPLNHGPRSRRKRIRALAIENIIASVDLDRECKYESCDFAASKKTLDGHHKICKHRHVPCPGYDCDANPTFSDLMAHIKAMHPETKFGILSPKYCLSDGSTYKRRYKTVVDDANLMDDGGWAMDIRAFRGKQFIPYFAVVNGMCYAWMYIIGDYEEAEMFQATIYIGERQQCAIAIVGKVFPIDTKKEVIMRQESGVLSFSPEGMGSSFFRDIPSGSNRIGKQATVYFSIIKSKEPHHLAGLHQLCQEGGGGPSSESEDARDDDTNFDHKRHPVDEASTPPPNWGTPIAYSPPNTRTPSPLSP